MEKFVLPEKWWIKATNDAEDAVIVEYINTKFHTFISSGIGTMSYWCYANYSLEDGYNKYNKYDTGIDTISGFDGVTQLTYDQFIRYVINKDIDKSCEHDPELEIILKRLLENE